MEPTPSPQHSTWPSKKRVENFFAQFEAPFDETPFRGTKWAAKLKEQAATKGGG